MKNISLSVPAGPGLGGANLVEMKREELLNINGGGWLARAIASIIRRLKCGCGSGKEDPHETHSEWHPGMNWF